MRAQVQSGRFYHILQIPCVLVYDSPFPPKFLTIRCANPNNLHPPLPPLLGSHLKGHWDGNEDINGCSKNWVVTLNRVVPWWMMEKQYISRMECIASWGPPRSEKRWFKMVHQSKSPQVKDAKSFSRVALQRTHLNYIPKVNTPSLADRIGPMANPYGESFRTHTSRPPVVLQKK